MATVYTPQGGYNPIAQQTQNLQEAFKQISQAYPTASPYLEAASSAQLNMPQYQQQAQEQLYQQSPIPALSNQYDTNSDLYKMLVADHTLSQKYTSQAPASQAPATVQQMMHSPDQYAQLAGQLPTTNVAGVQTYGNVGTPAVQGLTQTSNQQGFTGFTDPVLAARAHASDVSGVTSILNLLGSVIGYDKGILKSSVDQNVAGRQNQINSAMQIFNVLAQLDSQKQQQAQTAAKDPQVILTNLESDIANGMSLKNALSKYEKQGVDQSTIIQYNIRRNGPLNEDANGLAALGVNPETVKVFFPDYTGSGSAKVSEYEKERAGRVIQNVDELKSKVSHWTVGAIGNSLSNISGTPALAFKAQLEPLKSGIAFNELAQMRAASKTGGALGQVSTKEAMLLESALGALDTRQSPADFKKQLDKIRDSIERWQAAKGIPVTSTSSSGNEITQPDGTVWKKNSDGSYTRTK